MNEIIKTIVSILLGILIIQIGFKYCDDFEVIRLK